MVLVTEIEVLEAVARRYGPIDPSRLQLLRDAIERLERQYAGDAVDPRAARPYGQQLPPSEN